MTLNISREEEEVGRAGKMKQVVCLKMFKVSPMTGTLWGRNKSSYF